jgi:hypothetical protein
LLHPDRSKSCVGGEQLFTFFAYGFHFSGFAMTVNNEFGVGWVAKDGNFNIYYGLFGFQFLKTQKKRPTIINRFGEFSHAYVNYSLTHSYINN